jgi:hypothetical protein
MILIADVRAIERIRMFLEVHVRILLRGNQFFF